MFGDIQDEPHNPFQPPAVADQYEGLAPDTEFLVSGECVLGGDELALPAICIHTGRTQNLVTQSTELKWSPPRLTQAFVVLLIACPIVGWGAMEARRVNRGLAPALQTHEADVWTAASIAVSALTVLSWMLIAGMKRQVRVTWSVSEQFNKEQATRQRRWRVAASIFAVVFLISILMIMFLRISSGPILGLSFFLAALCIGQSRQRKLPLFIGRHAGLNVLTALSPEFLVEVQALIDRHGGQAHS